MASKDGRIPGFTVENESKENDDTLSEMSAPSPPPSFSPRRIIPAMWPQQEPASLNPPEYSPELWARKLLQTVNNPKEFNHKAALNIVPSPRPSLLPPSPRPLLSKPTNKRRKAPSQSTKSGNKHDCSLDSTESSWHKRVRRDRERKFFKSGNRVVHSWETALKGGSDALNECLQRLYPQVVRPHLTPLQTLQLVHSLRLQTIVPPEASPLYRVIQNSGYQNERMYGLDEESDEEENEIVQKEHASGEEELLQEGTNKSTTSIDEVEKADATPRPPSNNDEQQADDTTTLKPPELHFKTLARLYETMCQQDADDGSYNRRELQRLSPWQCVEKMRELETNASVLRLREEEIMGKARELGLINNTEICTMMGYWTPLQRYNSQSLMDTKGVQEEAQRDEKETLEQEEKKNSKEVSMQEEEEADS